MYVMSPKGHSKHDSQCAETKEQNVDVMQPFCANWIVFQVHSCGPNLLVFHPYPSNWQTPNCKINWSFKTSQKNPRTFEMPRNVFPFLTRKVGYPRFFSVGFCPQCVNPGPKAEARKMLWFTRSKSTILRHKWSNGGLVREIHHNWFFGYQPHLIWPKL